MAKTHLRADIIEVLRAQLAAGVTLLSADDITANVAASERAVKDPKMEAALNLL